jgi:predicted ATP-grasp superfamily ATP-dependent carboligase
MQQAGKPADAKLPAVVLGGGLTALSVSRSLAAIGVDVHVLDVHDSPARWSRAVSSFVDVGREQPQERMLEWLRSGPAPAVVLAAADEGLEVIARNRSILLDLGYRPMEADDEVLLAMLNKERTYELAREHGIPAPRTIPLRNRGELEAALPEIEFPGAPEPAQRSGSSRAPLSSARHSIGCPPLISKCS